MLSIRQHLTFLSDFAGGTESLPVGFKVCRWDSKFAGGMLSLPVGLKVCRWDSKFAGGESIK